MVSALVPNGSKGNAAAASPVMIAVATSGTGTSASCTSFSLSPWRGRMCSTIVIHCTSNLVTMPMRLPLRSAHDLTLGCAMMIAQFADEEPTTTLGIPAAW